MSQAALQNEPFSSHLGTRANALLWNKTYTSTVKGTLKFPVGWYVFEKHIWGSLGSQKSNVTPVVCCCAWQICVQHFYLCWWAGYGHALWAMPGKGGVAGRRKPAAWSVGLGGRQGRCCSWLCWRLVMHSSDAEKHMEVWLTLGNGFLSFLGLLSCSARV